MALQMASMSGSTSRIPSSGHFFEKSSSCSNIGVPNSSGNGRRGVGSIVNKFESNCKAANAYSRGLYTSQHDSDHSNSSDSSGVESFAGESSSVASGGFLEDSRINELSIPQESQSQPQPQQKIPKKKKIIMIRATGLNSSSHSKTSLNLSGHSRRSVGFESLDRAKSNGLGDFISSRSMHGRPFGGSIDSKRREELLKQWKLESKTVDGKENDTHSKDCGSEGDSLDSSSIDSGVGAADDEWWQSSDEEKDSEKHAKGTDKATPKIKSKETAAGKKEKKQKSLFKVRAKSTSSVSSRSLHGTPFDGFRDPKKLHELLSNWTSERSLGLDDYSTSVSASSASTGASVATEPRGNTTARGKSKHRRRSRSRNSRRSQSPATAEEFSKQGISGEQLLQEDDNDSLTKNPMRRRSKSRDTRKPGTEQSEATCESSYPHAGHSSSPGDKRGSGNESGKGSERRRKSLVTGSSYDLNDGSRRSERRRKSIGSGGSHHEQLDRSRRSERRRKSIATSSVDTETCEHRNHPEGSKRSERRSRSVAKGRLRDHPDGSKRSERHSRSVAKGRPDDHPEGSKRSERHSRSIAKGRPDDHSKGSKRPEHRSRSVAKGRPGDHPDGSKRSERRSRSVVKGRPGDHPEGSKRSERRSRSVAKGRPDDHPEGSKRSERRSRSVAKGRTGDHLEESKRSEHRSRSVAKGRSEKHPEGSKRSERSSRTSSKSVHDDGSRRSERNTRSNAGSRYETLLGNETTKGEVNEKVLETGIITKEQIGLLKAAGFGLHELF